MQLPAEISDDSSQITQMQEALRIRLDDDEMVYEAATGFIADRIQPGIKRITTFFEPLKKKAFEAHREITKAEASALVPYEAIKEQVSREATAWSSNRDRMRREVLKRERAEASALGEQLVIEEATALAGAGDQEGAAALLAAPVKPVTVASSAPSVPKVSGVSGSARWVGEVQEPEKFLRWIAENYKARQHYLAGFNQGELNRKATSDRIAFDIPGCVAKEEKSTKFRSGVINR